MNEVDLAATARAAGASVAYALRMRLYSEARRLMAFAEAVVRQVGRPEQAALIREHFQIVELALDATDGNESTRWGSASLN